MRNPRLALLVCLVDVRDEIANPVHTVLQRMFESAEEGDFETIIFGLDMLAPLSRHLRETLGVDVATPIEDSISIGDSGEVVRGLQRYVVLSITSLLQESVALDANQVVEKLRFMIQEKVVLDPYVARQDARAGVELTLLIPLLTARAGTWEFQASAEQFTAVLARVFPSTPAQSQFNAALRFERKVQ